MATPVETVKKESLGISAALILSLVGVTLILIIAIIIKRELTRSNAKARHAGHFWTCKFFGKNIVPVPPGTGPSKSRPQFLLVGHHELPRDYHNGNECPQYLARMFTVDLFNVLDLTFREAFADMDAESTMVTFLHDKYPGLLETAHAFRRLKVRAEIDLVPFTLNDAKHGVDYFNQILQKISEFANNPYLRKRQVDTSKFMSHHHESDEPPEGPMTSSAYLPLLPKDLCQIPLRARDDDSMGNLRKKGFHGIGKFPFHMPAFLRKARFFSTSKSQANSTTARRTKADVKNDLPLELHASTLDSAPPPLTTVNVSSSNDELTRKTNLVSSFENPLSKQTRQRLKRQGATDSVPLVEFNDTLSRSTTISSDLEHH